MMDLIWVSEGIFFTPKSVVRLLQPFFVFRHFSNCKREENLRVNTANNDMSASCKEMLLLDDLWSGILANSPWSMERIFPWSKGDSDCCVRIFN